MLSIIIVTYKNEETICECIKSIYKYSKNCNFEVVIVDNSPNSTSAILVEKEFRDLNNLLIIRNTFNGGFGYGNNIGVKRSSGKYLLFLNPDTVIIEPFINKIVRILEARKTISAVGCHLVSRNLKTVMSFSIFPEKLSLLSTSKFYKILLRYKDIILKNFFPWGAFFAVRRCDFFSAGLFDENLFLNFEEPDLMRRLPTNFIYILKEKVIHAEGCSKNKLNESNYQFLSEEYYFSKYNNSVYDKYKKVVLLRLFIKNKIFRQKLSENEKMNIARYSED